MIPLSGFVFHAGPDSVNLKPATMLNLLIIEEKKPALSNLVSDIQAVAGDVRVVAALSTVQESIAYLNSHAAVNLIVSEVQLGDGLSFEIFRQCENKTPVIFITRHDKFGLDTVETNCIDYLVKPVCPDKLRKAFIKYRMLEEHFTMLPRQQRKWLLVKKGLENIPLRLEDIVLFYTENKIAYVIDKQCRQYLVDDNLSELSQWLDTSMFFRVNRQYIININFIKNFKPFERVKLVIELCIPSLEHLIVVSQESAPQFRNWISSV
jgi:DNA-binding LytR/AlgR family response regulator